MGGMNPGDITSGRDTIIINEAPIPTIQSLHQLRAPVADFVGRQDEIERLMQAISAAAKSSAVAISGARGLGGMGKTQLALAVAQRLKDTFPDAQLLVELRGASSNPLTPEQALQTIIRAFEPLAHLPDTLDALQSVYLSLLDGKRVLILADDARDARQVEPLLPPSGCALLLTSRQRFPLPGMQTLDLEVLSQEEAEGLLLKIAPRIGPAASRMAELCGYLPLALRLSAGICANSTMSIERHLKALEAETRLAYMRDPNTSVEASLKLSYDALDPQAQRILCQLSIFPSSFDMLAAKEIVQVSAAEAEGQGTDATQGSVEEMLDLLYSRSLLEWDEQTERFSLHDLVRVFGLERLEGEGEEAMRLRHAQHYIRVAAAAKELYKSGEDNVLLGLTLFDGERANIDAGWKWAREQTGGASQEIDELLLYYADATTYVGELRYDNRRERIPQLEAALGAARRLKHREGEGVVLGNMGLAYAAVGELGKAIEYYEQRLQIAREMEDRLGEGSALGNLGLAYAAVGEPRKAIHYYEQHLQIAREMGDRLGEGNALGNLGNAYMDMGEPRKAIHYYEQHLQIARQIGYRLGEGQTLGNLGNAYTDLGEADKAIEYHEQRLQIAREMGDRLGEGQTLGNLGNAYADLGEPRKAIHYYEQHLQIAREMGDRLGEGQTLGNLGATYADMGEAGKAIQYYEQDLQIARQIGNRRGEAIASWNMGLLLAKEGDVARAVELMQVLVDYEHEIGHSDAEKHAAYVEELRKRLS